MIDALHFAAWGLAAGLGVAMPLGAIGVLVVRTGMRSGFRAGAAAGLGVAAVDLAYCAVAIWAGAWLAPLIERWSGPTLVASGAALLGIAAAQARDARRPATGEDSTRTLPAGRRFAGFVALTAINPVTVLYFAALAGIVAAQEAGPTESVAFVIGVGVASALWQVGLAAVGAALRHTLSPRTASVLAWAGVVVVAGLAIAAIVRGLTELT